MSTTEELRQRIADALEIVGDGLSDGDHHKTWYIDQMVRALTGCPLVERTGTDARGEPYTYEALGESEEYRNWVAAYEIGEDGPETYSWDEGIAP